MERRNNQQIRLGSITPSRVTDAHEMYVAVKGKVNRNNMTPRLRI